MELAYNGWGERRNVLEATNRPAPICQSVIGGGAVSAIHAAYAIMYRTRQVPRGEVARATLLAEATVLLCMRPQAGPASRPLAPCSWIGTSSCDAR